MISTAGVEGEPQTGEDLAVFVDTWVDAFGGRRGGLVCDPWTARAADPVVEADLEGCLSLPGAHPPVARPDFAVCEGLDRIGQPVRVAGTGTLASCLQHETDHLRGAVVDDHLTREERLDLRRQHLRAASQHPSSWST